MWVSLWISVVCMVCGSGCLFFMVLSSECFSVIVLLCVWLCMCFGSVFD